MFKIIILSQIGTYRYQKHIFEILLGELQGEIMPPPHTHITVAPGSTLLLYPFIFFYAFSKFSYTVREKVNKISRAIEIFLECFNANQRLLISL